MTPAADSPESTQPITDHVVVPTKSLPPVTPAENSRREKLSPLLLEPGRLFVIAGPCVIESLEQCLFIARSVDAVCRSLNIRFIFKASFDKANRSSGGSFRGPGLTDGLAVLRQVREAVGCPVLTDVHTPEQAEPVAREVDVLQIPAFLARQTDLLLACGRTGRTINVKKGQFMSPAEMQNAVDKIRSTGNENVWLCERGTFFGYNRLVNDFTGLAVMHALRRPVVFDASHSTQQPAGNGTQSGGQPQYTPMLARAAVATGCVDGLFIECHPNPTHAKSDAATVLNLSAVPQLLKDCAAVHALVRKTTAEPL